MMSASPRSPRIKVVGVYSPQANEAEYAAFVAREVASQNPINFREETKEFLKRVGREAEIAPLSEEELEERRECLEQDLSKAVLIEVVVSHPDSRFSIGDFVQANPEASQSQWQAAWCEKFLTPDGKSLLGEYMFNQLPSVQEYRVAFYIHSWKHSIPLLSTYGPLQYGELEPMPLRLWRLAPYELVD